MMLDICEWQKGNRIDICRIVDISGLPFGENRGLPYAVLIAKALPKKYVLKLAEEAADFSVLSQVEEYTDNAADSLAEMIRKRGFCAVSQSEGSLRERKEYYASEKNTPLPHKKVAVLSGCGWIGKNGLFVTEEYGCALSMCTVLTDMPLHENARTIKPPRCGECEMCVQSCPMHILHGASWRTDVRRDEIINVDHCEKCLKCLVKCRYSMEYARSAGEHEGVEMAG